MSSDASCFWEKEKGDKKFNNVKQGKGEKEKIEKEEGKARNLKKKKKGERDPEIGLCKAKIKGKEGL